MKRCFDVVLAVVAIVFFTPLLLLTATAIWIESGGPILFRQARTGLNERKFMVYKFRSMRVQENGATVKQATKGDSRITKVGAFIRTTSIDELPQLFNVLRGEMSLVGPRPHAVAHDDYFSAAIPNYSQRFQTRPGITGWAQVSGHRGETKKFEDMARRIDHDIEYIERWSMLLDLRILVKTAIVVPFDRSVY